MRIERGTNDRPEGRRPNNRTGASLPSDEFRSALLTRDEFRDAVFARDGHKCVICGKAAVDAHHVVERRLFDAPDELGGYFLDNGAALCEEHHLAAEMTTLSCDSIRAAARITSIILPEHLEADAIYDKWGDTILKNGLRSPGELFQDESVHAILSEGGVLDTFTPFVKYPRTLHVPWSPGRSDDDRVLPSVEHFMGKEVVVSEKVDGECSTIYGKGLGMHARSVDGRSHPSRDWLKNLYSRIQHEIPDHYRICGENMFSTHSIHYRSLPSYFLVYSMWDAANMSLSWDETVEWANLLGLHTVTVLYRGIWDEDTVKRCFTGRSLFGGEQEGYVIRLADRFHYARFRWSVAKFVRAGHVQTDQHWRNKEIVPNELAGSPPQGQLAQ